MNKEVKAKWVAALRSGDYKQATGELGRKNTDGTTRHCCLGVLCELAVQAEVIEPGEVFIADDSVARDHTLWYDNTCEVLPNSVREWAGLVEDNPVVPLGVHSGVSLTELNDGVGAVEGDPRTFREIADIIEETL